MAEIDISRFSTHIDVETINRFIKFIVIDKNTGAWIWCGGITGSGYGAFWYKGKTVSAHRFAFELVNGEIQDDLFVCHKYESLGKNNVNPDHLFLGTATDNMSDATNKNRMPFGVHNSQAKLSKSKVKSILASHITYQELSRQHKISLAKISQIKRGLSWKKDTKIEKVKIHSLRNKTGYRGVRVNQNKKMKSIRYRAAITVTKNGEKEVIDLGSYECPIEAAKAFDRAAIKYRGKSAKINFPE